MTLYLGSQKIASTNKMEDPPLIPRYLSGGVYQLPYSDFAVTLPSNAVDVAAYGLYNAFQNCSSLTSADFSSLTTVSGDSGMYGVLYSCSKVSSVDLSGLTTVSGGNGLYQAFYSCSKLASVDLSSLATVSGPYAFRYAFRNCISLKSLSFPALTSTSFGGYASQFNHMLRGVTGCTVHFPSNLQTVIGSWGDVTAGFGGTNTTVLFDLPATE